ncbi:flippase-like domain-containing protein [Chryseobacterium sp. SNU WT5]|uniref:lysylphosphatidylglycerol synthase transmembrane domain-containing protein n=1 Tax=Chryseobacterium sp. SNU WT5 TaxID=2594269 RepID=UPI001180ACB9|nr:lysylphosphatidylglycerol synthase transmembrane domain-containing protein [Chryseobacterium sp. SNU WT5]QDP84387.1 flippase-like domain-containing protein [Chryseobacterium sp. SNU WT5]
MDQNKKANPLKTFLTIAVSLSIAALFMWWALKGMEFKKIAGYFAKANYLWVFAAALFGILAYWFRAVRWNLLLEPMGYKISNSNSLWTISFGYLMNLTIPRSGELARSTALFSVENVPVEKSFGTIILERVVDLLCMMVFLGLTLLFKYKAIFAFYHYITEEKGKAAESSSNNTLFIVLGAFVIIAIVLILLRKKLEHLTIYQKVVNFGKGLFHGLTSIFKMKQKGKFLAYTVGIWMSYYMAAYLVCFALPETSQFTFTDGFFIIVVGTLGMMVPASGGIGAFHLALKFGIMALFLSMGKNPEEGGEVGLSYAFISHTMQLVIMLVMGAISIPVLAKSRSRASGRNL